MFKPWDECLKDGVATFDCLPIIFSNLLSAILAFAGFIALAMFIMGGFKLMYSGGDAKKAEGAKKNFTFGIIGLAIVLFSFLLINIISQVTGVKCLFNLFNTTNFSFGCQ